MKVALVHDYLIDYGGAEVVLSALHEIYPQAPLYTLVLEKKRLGKFWGKFKDAKIITSWFNDLPFASRLISPLRFLLPLIWTSFDFSDFDVVITSASWAITKGVKKGNKTIEICYLHTPPRYLYGYDTSRKWQCRWFAPLIDFYALIVNHFLRQFDFKQAQKVDYFVANSENVGQRIKKFYRRSYQVLYPPVEIPSSGSSFSGIKRNYFLTGGRLVVSKNFDLVIKACQKLGKPLKIFGVGPEETKLKKLAGKKIEFVGQVTDAERSKLYQGAKAFIAAQKDEDFGLTPVEAQGNGCPVIAFRGGGYLESVVENKTGIFFDQLTAESLEEAIKKLERVRLNSAVFGKPGNLPKQSLKKKW